MGISDGLGFEEVNQASSTEIISGTNVYAKTTVQGDNVIGDVVSGTNVYAKTTVQGDNVIGDIVSGTNVYATNNFISTGSTGVTGSVAGSGAEFLQFRGGIFVGAV